MSGTQAFYLASPDTGAQNDGLLLASSNDVSVLSLASPDITTMRGVMMSHYNLMKVYSRFPTAFTGESWGDTLVICGVWLDRVVFSFFIF